MQLDQLRWALLLDRACPFLIRHPVIAIAYGPLVAFGLLNFVIGNRAIFIRANHVVWSCLFDHDNGSLHCRQPI